MLENSLEMPFLFNMGMVVTYKCQVACPHCIIEAGPHRTEEMKLEDACKWIQQIVNYGNGQIKVLSLTGGEPFYDKEKLKKITSFADANGLVVTVVTNAFWASTIERAVETLKEFPEIKMVAFSTDIYHQKCIPFEKVKNAIAAAKKCGVPFEVAVCTENKNERDT